LFRERLRRKLPWKKTPPANHLPLGHASASPSLNCPPHIRAGGRSGILGCRSRLLCRRLRGGRLLVHRQLSRFVTFPRGQFRPVLRRLECLSSRIVFELIVLK
ncbi:hypothetical protein MRX96_048940, partial [Rhipicephalus microplus]